MVLVVFVSPSINQLGASLAVRKGRNSRWNLVNMVLSVTEEIYKHVFILAVLRAFSDMIEVRHLRPPTH